MTYNFSVALHYLTLHQIIQKLEKLIFLLKCIARWFLNLDTGFNWAPLPFSIISWVRCTALSPDGFFVGTVWQGFGGGRGSLFSSLPAAALNMAHHDGKEMNKDELSALKISHRAEAVHTPQPICEFSKEKKALPPSIYLYINIGRVVFSILYLGTFGAFVRSRMAFWVVHITPCASEAIHTAPFGTVHTEHWTEPWKHRRCNW